jgi:type II secretory pathway component GspD/PulD (secretin)
MRSLKLTVSAALVLALTGIIARAQTEDAVAKPNSYPTQVFYLNNISGVGEASEIVTAIRNLLDAHGKIFLVSAQNALFIQAPPDQLVLAKKIIDDLDHAKRTYRLTYTITEIDDGKRSGTQHFSMVLVSGQRTSMKQGSKVPVATGTTSENGSASTQTQFTYLDVGLNFDATLDESVNGVRLRSKAEQSSLGSDKYIAGVQEPVVRQTVLEGTSILTPGKPLILGSLDVPDSTRRLDIEVVMEVVK